MKKALFVSLLCLALVLLAACQPKANPDQNIPEANVQVQGSPMEAALQPPPAVEGLPPDYNPADEESNGTMLADTLFDELGIPLYAGATPIPLDPVDMPTPTPRQALAFTFATYTAANLGLTFESVAGYLVDDSQPDIYILTEPAEQIKDNYAVVFTFARSAVTSTYTATNIRADLRAFADDLGKVNYKEWRISETSERTLLGKPGYYITYRGVQHDGTIVRGRVHMALLDNNRLLTLHYTGPAEYNSDYTDVFYRIRSTLKAT